MSDTVLNGSLESKLTQRLDVVATVAAVALLCHVALDEDISWLVWVIVAGAIALLTVTRWPYGALLVLVGMSAMPRFFVELFGWKARPEHFASVFISVAVAAWLLVSKRRFRLHQLDYWILAYVLINFASSVFGSLLPSATFRWALQNSLAVLPYFLIRMLVPDLEVLSKAFRILLAVGVVESVYGIICYVSHHLFSSTFGMDFAYLVDVAAAYGSLYEPNLFGAYTACCAVLGLAVYLMEGRHFRYMICFLIASLATVASLSRAALVALVITCPWVFWQARHARTKSRSRTATLVLGFGLISVIAVLAVGGVLQERFSNLFNQGLAEETTITRLVVIEEAMQEVPKHLLLGSGTASFNLSFDWGRYVPEWAGSATWIANAPLRILHDTGLLGLISVLGFLVSVWWRVRLALRRGGGQIALLVALSAGALLYGISFQATDGTILAFSWVHLGFLASAVILIDGSGKSATAWAAQYKGSV